MVTSDQPNPAGTPQDVLDWGIQGAADPHRARLQSASIALGMLVAIRGDAFIACLQADVGRPRFTIQEDRELAAWCLAHGGTLNPHNHSGRSTLTSLTFGAIDVDVTNWRTDDELLAYARDLAGRVLPEDGGPALCEALRAATVKRGTYRSRVSGEVLLPLDVARRACEVEAGLEDAVLVYVDLNTARVDLDGLRRRVRA